MKSTFQHILFICITFLFSLCCNAQDLTAGSKKSAFQLDKTIIFSFRADTDSVPAEKFLYTYDSLGNNISYIAQEWDKFKKQWASYEKRDFAYNSKGQVILFQKFNRELDQWVPNDQKIETEYNSDGQETLKTFSVYNKKAKKWSFSSKTESKYTNGKKTLEMVYLWDPPTNNWVNNTKHEKTYDEKGRETRFQIFVWDTKSNNWVFTGKHVHRYDVDGHKILEVHIVWDGMAKQWNYAKDTAVAFDAKGNVAAINGFVYNEKVNKWVMKSKTESKYDANNNELTRIFSELDSAQKVIASMKTDYTYDAKTHKTSESVYYWSAQRNTWIADHRLDYAFDLDPKNSIAEYDADRSTNQFYKKRNVEVKKDNKGNLLSRITDYDFDPATKHFKNRKEESYTYNADGNLYLLKYSDQDLGTNQRKSLEKAYYFYSRRK